MRGLGSFLRGAWRLSLPYFRSDERWIARGLLATTIALNLLLVAINVILNYWNRDLYNSLQQKDWHAFLALIFWWNRDKSGFMPGFVLLVSIFIPVAIYRTYLRQWLEIRWRRWMTERVLGDWLSDRAYYRISLAGDPRGTGTDNPDQRIGDDIRDFIGDTLTLGLGLLSNVVNLISFLSILWTLSGALKVFGVTIPGYMVWVALIYSVFGTWLTHLVGRPLIFLNFQRQRVEADFRFALVRLRENVEGVALQGGEAEERQGLLGRFSEVVTNWWGIMRRTKALNAMVAGYGQVANIFPLVVAAPRYFSGQIALGGLMQTADAFGQVQGGLSWAVDAYASLARWRSEVDRLTTFLTAVESARDLAGTGIAIRPGDPSGWTTENLTLRLPNGAPLFDGAGLAFPPGADTLISGRSGTGKSTLFRALAGIWPFGSGTIRRPPGTSLFLPQRPYIPLGTLRHALTYPAPAAAYPDAAIHAALADVGLAALAPELDLEESWTQRLSGGEQQRVAVARALLMRPDWLFLDEATASLDPEAETELYQTLRARLPATTIVSIAHRPAIARFHEAQLVLGRTPGQPGRLAQPATSSSIAAP